MSTSGFDGFFACAMGFEPGQGGPYPWQRWLAENGLPEVLDVPTGLGKTEGVALAWAWRRLVTQQPDEPRHLVYCLPMRVLVRQTVERLRSCFARLHGGGYFEEVKVYTLMGGEIEEEWASRPEAPWVLVGTQDQVLSRALNRGYAMSRYAWPVHFGLLNNDCHWVLDETQLMGPGVWTSAQLDWMRKKRFPTLLPCRTTWMSATIGLDFLATSDRRRDGLAEVHAMRMSWEQQLQDPGVSEAAKMRVERLRKARRPAEFLKPPTGKRARALAGWLASKVEEQHEAGTLTLVVCNTVGLAQEIFDALSGVAPGILLTSRFRPQDRQEAERRLYHFELRRRTSPDGRVPDDLGLICVSTQVIEAGIDVSAHCLFSELAPWPSMVQRLGRLNRDGVDNGARAFFWPWQKIDRGAERAGPYPLNALKQGKQLVERYAELSNKAPASSALESLREDDLYKEAMAADRYPYPRAFDVHGLFATEPDVHGGFTDVSPFVRGTDPEADVAVFWRDWDGRRSPDELEGPAFVPEEACSVGFWKLRDFLGKKRAWLWNEQRARWEAITGEGIRPGMVLMLPRSTGGYSRERGWTGMTRDVLADVPPPGPGSGFDDDPHSEAGYWISIEDHHRDAEDQAKALVNALVLRDDHRSAVVRAASLHDLGKAHPRWNEALPARLDRRLLAKCPHVLAVDVRPSERDAVYESVNAYLQRASALKAAEASDGSIQLRWALELKLTDGQLSWIRTLPGVRRARHLAFRPGMRHEAASALALWHRYQSGEADWPALTVYLVAAHHGKVRTVLRSRGDGSTDVYGVPRVPPSIEFRGTWALDFDVALDGMRGSWSAERFIPSGSGWTGLVVDLLGPWSPDGEPWDTGTIPADEPRALGPFALAYLEALVRVADWRASGAPSRAIYPALMSASTKGGTDG